MVKIIYVACPYSDSDETKRKLNVEAARYAGYNIVMSGGYPIMPTVNTAGFDNAPLWPPTGISVGQWWYQATVDLMLRCDAVYVVDGFEKSKGVINEIEKARSAGIPVFFSLDELRDFIHFDEAK